MTDVNHCENREVACAHLARDLQAVGVAPDAIERVVTFYDRALLERSMTAWKRFYVAAFQSLRTAAAGRRTAPAQFEIAARSLLTLLEDDLGATLIDETDMTYLRLQLSDKPAGVESKETDDLGSSPIVSERSWVLRGS